MRSYVRVDDQMPDNPKIAEVGPLGLAMHVAALCYSNRHLTDGRIPTAAAKLLLSFDGIGWWGTDEEIVWSDVVAVLVKAGLWHEVDGGWVINDYLEYQRSAAQVRSLSESRAEAGRRGGSKGQAKAKQTVSTDRTLSVVGGASNDGDDQSQIEARGAAPSEMRRDAMSRRDDGLRSEANGQANRKQTGSKPEAEQEQEQEQSLTSEPARTDVDSLCALLADCVGANTKKRPAVTARWRDEARRLLDIDKVPLAEAEKVARWCTADSFWRSNILGMPKFREKYPQLRLRMESERNPQPLKVVEY